MFIPPLFQNTNPDEIKNFIQHNGFAILISQSNGKLWGSHIPLLLSEDGSKLYGHVSRANPQWKDLESGEVLAIFNGPHTYISSSWYDHENVPTWNYIAIHVYGTVKLIDGDLRWNSLKQLVDQYEKDSAEPVSLEGMRPEYVTQSLRGLVAFEVTINKIEAAYKLSQNRDEKNHQAIIDQLHNRNDHESDLVAQAMKNSCPHHKPI
jgi:transcriptional regulator